jgi:polyhydroxybutyrate depolymerase
MQFLLALLLGSAAAEPEIWKFEIGGVTREATVYAARTPSPAGSPLVFGFHGHGGNMRNAARSFQMHELWPEATVVYMQGLPTPGRITDAEGKRPGWQFAVHDQGGRDLVFFDQALARAKKEHRIDPKRVFAMGHSNGGRFTYVLWAARGDVFAAFAPSASPATGLVLRMKPKPAFVLAGKADALVSYESQERTIEALKRLLGCSSEPKMEGHLSLFRGRDGVELATYVTPGGHEYMREANPKVVEFFRRQ